MVFAGNQNGDYMWEKERKKQRKKEYEITTRKNWNFGNKNVAVWLYYYYYKWACSLMSIEIKLKINGHEAGTRKSLISRRLFLNIFVCTMAACILPHFSLGVLGVVGASRAAKLIIKMFIRTRQGDR